MPNLVNLNEDPQLSEMLLYVLKDGKSHVGRMKEDSTHEIQLNGALIADNHWLVNMFSILTSQAHIALTKPFTPKPLLFEMLPSFKPV